MIIILLDLDNNNSSSTDNDNLRDINNFSSKNKFKGSPNNYLCGGPRKRETSRSNFGDVSVQGKPPAHCRFTAASII